MAVACASSYHFVIILLGKAWIYHPNNMIEPYGLLSACGQLGIAQNGLVMYQSCIIYHSSSQIQSKHMNVVKVLCSGIKFANIVAFSWPSQENMYEKFFSVPFDCVMTSYFWYGTVYCVIHDWTDIIISIYYHMGLNDAASHPLPSITLNIVQPNRTVTTTTHNDAQECIESRCRAHRFIIWDGVESSLRLSGQTLNICILHVQHCIVPHSYCVVAVNNKAKCGSPVNNTMFCVSVHSSSDWLNVAT